MNDVQASKGALAPYRVLDLTDEKGYFCGRILGDLGADVIKIERPSGDGGRRVGPFYHDIPDGEKSLYWFAYNMNKRGITLNLQTSDGKEIFKRLVKSADFVIESFHPGYMDDLGLGYSVLKEINPRLVMTAITPFGQSGPYRDFKSSDLALRVSLKSPDSNRIYRDSFPQAVADSDVVEAAETAHDRLSSGQVTGVSVERPAESREDDIGGGDAQSPFFCPCIVSGAMSG